MKSSNSNLTTLAEDLQKLLKAIVFGKMTYKIQGHSPIVIDIGNTSAYFINTIFLTKLVRI